MTRPDQTRPDQTRPDQTRPDQTRPPYCVNLHIRLFGKNLLTSYDHYICRLRWQNMKPVLRNRLAPFEITPENLHLVNGSKALCKLLSLQPRYAQGWGFRDNEGRMIGKQFLVRKGGNEMLYKIRNIDAYICAGEVFAPYRGNEYKGEMVTWLFTKLHDEEGIDELYLAVKRDNRPALRANEKLGFEVVGRRLFFRAGRIVIPYFTL